MLELTITGEYYDEDDNCFVTVGPKIVQLEHSLLSLSKWESKWKKPFLSEKDNKSIPETIDYIRMMLIEPLSDLELGLLINEHFQEINDYIESRQTATTIATPPSRSHGQTVTAELIYYWMFSAGIPADPCETWHLSRLLTLIEVFAVKNAPKKKMKRGDISKMYRSLNAQRRAQTGSKG